MSLLRSLVQRLRVVVRRGTVDDELQRELDDHFEREVERQQDRGLTLDEARRRARLRVGGADAIAEDVRDERGGRLLLDAIGDLRVGARGLARSPGFTATAALSLALGVAGVTAIGSVVHVVIVRPLPYPDADRLHLVRVAWNAFSAPLSAADLLRVQEASGGLADVAAYRFGAEGYTLLGHGEPQVVSGAAVTLELPRVLGVQPALGRWLSEQRDAREVLIGDALWRRLFGGAADVLGRPLTLDRGVYTIVGVMPPGYDVPGQSRGEIWIAAPLDEPERRGPFFLHVVLRLRPGVGPGQAAAGLTAAVLPVLEARYAAEPTWRYLTTPAKDVVVGETRRTLWLFLAAVTLVLAIATVNVASLVLARGASRTRELALRASLGARRERLVRQLLAESVLIGGGSAVIGLAGAAALLRVIVAQAEPLIPRVADVRLDTATAGLAVVVGLGTALLTGIAPALWLTGRHLGQATRSGGRMTTGGPVEGRVRRGLVVAEVALAVCVLVATTLLVKTMRRVNDEPPGFAAAGVLSLRVAAPPDPYDDEVRLYAYLRDLDARLRALPGVTHVALSESLPPDRLQQSNNYTLQGEEPGSPGRTSQGSGVAQWNVVSPEFFATLGVPLIEGRAFSDGDGASSPRVAVVSRAFAQRHFPGRTAIGGQLKTGDWDAAAPWLTIVGVVGDMPYEQGAWGGLAPTLYLPLAQTGGSRWQFMTLRTRDLDGASAGLAAALHAADPRVPLRDVATMAERLSASAARPRFRMRLFTALAAVAVSLALTGLYGVLAYQVSQRRKETAVRRALGATSSTILGEVVRSGLGLTALGVSIGLVAALAGSRALAAFLFGVASTDPAAFAIAAGILLGAAVLACVMPAWRAVAADPLIVLRED